MIKIVIQVITFEAQFKECVKTFDESAKFLNKDNCVSKRPLLGREGIFASFQRRTIFSRQMRWLATVIP